MVSACNGVYFSVSIAITYLPANAVKVTNIFYICNLEPSVRTELVEQLPSVCIVLSELQLSMEPIPKYILPIIVRYLTDQHNQVTVIKLMEFILKHFVIVSYQ